MYQTSGALYRSAHPENTSRALTFELAGNGPPICEGLGFREKSGGGFLGTEHKYQRALRCADYILLSLIFRLACNGKSLGKNGDDHCIHRLNVDFQAEKTCFRG